MSVPMDHTEQSLEAVSQPTDMQNWTINVSYIRTIKVSNVSLAVSEIDIKEFFSYSGDIQNVEMQRENETTQVVYVTFKDPQGANTAILLSGATISGLPITITLVEDYRLPPEAGFPDGERMPTGSTAVVKKAEDMVSTMLARGFVLGKDAINKAKTFDEQHQLTSNASATVTSIDNRMGLSEKFSTGTAIVTKKLKEVDEQFQVSEKTKYALAAAEQTATNAGSAIMSNRHILTGVTWVSSAFNAVTKAAEDVSLMTKEKVEKAEEAKKDTIYKERTGIINDSAQNHLDNSSRGGAPIAPNSTESKLGNI